MNWTILGAGAIGALFATQLHRLEENVRFLDLRQTVNTRRQFHLTTLTHESYAADLEITSNVGGIDCLLVTTKVWQIEAALTPLIPLLSESTPIVLIHNGMGTTEWVKTHFPHNPLIACVISAGAYKPDRYSVIHSGFGECWCGALNDAGAQFQTRIAKINQALGHAKWAEQIEEKQWRKLVVNAVINPLTATLNVKNGELIHQAAKIKNLCDELTRLLTKLGFRETSEEWMQLVMTVISRTAENYSSMQQDISHQRKSEIEFITGHILRQAAEYDLAMPTHHQLYKEVVALESRYSAD